MEQDNTISRVVDLSSYNTQGFCPGYTLRRHIFEAEANDGSHEARLDWQHHIGPVDQFGGCNPINGNFTSVVLPLCRPERLRLVSYIHEYAFLHDNVVEATDSADTLKGGDVFALTGSQVNNRDAETGRKQIQAKIMLQLKSTDEICAERLIRVWKTMLATTHKDKLTAFACLEDYLNFRIVDCGAPFVESVMLFGMGMTLTPEEDEMMAPILRPCYAALALTNDYFSFDREWEAAQEPGASKPINAVWLFMQWEGVDIKEAKQLVRQSTNQYEAEFLDLCAGFRDCHPPISEKFDTYLRAMSYQVSGNLIWSLNCPRYHPEYRYDPNVGMEDALSADHGWPAIRVQDCPFTPFKRHSSIASTESSITSDSESGSSSSVSSRPSVSSLGDTSSVPDFKILTETRLTTEHVDMPFNYVRSMPSKGARDMLIDALNLWSNLPRATTDGIKNVVSDLHTASLIFDDVEDGSELRRGQPAAHTVFGIPQSINSASFIILEAVSKAKVLPITHAIDIVLEQLHELHVGQSYDLHWTRHNICPSEDEYLEMISKKTGGLFRLLSRLMSASLSPCIASQVDELVTLIGVYFQIRDDYQNLSSSEYEDQKGFCEDLDEGKFSFPLIHCLQSEAVSPELREVLRCRQHQGGLSKAQKMLVLDRLGRSGGLESTLHRLRQYECQLDKAVAALEKETGQENWMMRLFLHKLRI